ncbi:MAG: response regulator [Desulfobacterales bacterium]|nr:response regulator [Desulfobacterales bacterium]
MNTKHDMLISETQYRQILDMATDGILIFDADIGKITDVNSSLSDMIGYSKEELLGKTIGEISSFTNIEAFKELQTKEYIRYEYLPIETKTGKIIVEFVGNVYIVNNKKIIQCNVHNITKQKILEEIRHKYDFIANISKSPMAFINKDYIYEAVNSAYYQSHKKSIDEIIGNTVENIWGKETFQNIIKGYIDICLSGKEVSYESWFEFDSLGLRCYKVDYYPYRYKKEDVSHILVISHDITELKHTQKLLEIAKNKAEIANQSKSIFLANMSHELRTPLNSIIGFIDLLENKRIDRLDENEDKWIHYIKVSSTYLLELINDILDLSKIEAGKVEINKKPFPYNDMLKRSPLTLKSIASKKKINMIVNIEDDLGWLNGDEVRIKQIIFNLLSNAIKFTNDGNRIGIDAWAEGDKIITVVWDEGIGIPKQYLEKIFDPFEQVNDCNILSNGTGLGLAISKKFIELHGGTITVESIYGKGSRFIIILPERIDVQSEKKETRKISTISNIKPKSNIYILVVEDNENNLELIKDIMELNGYYFVDYVDTGEKTLELLLSKTYDLILMDVKLEKGNIDGVETMKIIKSFSFKTSSQKNIPIIALTAFAMKGDKERYIKEGFDDYISKPIDTGKLFEAINRLINNITNN